MVVQLFKRQKTLYSGYSNSIFVTWPFCTFCTRPTWRPLSLSVALSEPSHDRDCQTAARARTHTHKCLLTDCQQGLCNHIMMSPPNDKAEVHHEDIQHVHAVSRASHVLSMLMFVWRPSVWTSDVLRSNSSTTTNVFFFLFKQDYFNIRGYPGQMRILLSLIEQTWTSFWRSLEKL